MRAVPVNGCVVREIRAGEWRQVKELRLLALRDPAAPIAFLESYEDAAGKEDAFWRERATRAAVGGGDAVRQFVAETADGKWVGSVTVLMEETGSEDWAGSPVERRQGHVVGVFVSSGHRGGGLIRALLDAGAAWAWEQGAERVRLLVHERNERAQAAYRRAGFTPTGVTVEFEKDQVGKELEFARERPVRQDVFRPTGPRP